MFARIGVMRALNRNFERVFGPGCSVKIMAHVHDAEIER